MRLAVPRAALAAACAALLGGAPPLAPLAAQAVRTDAGFGATAFPRCDDACLAGGVAQPGVARSLGFAARFYGQTFTSVFVNNNGAAHLGAPRDDFDGSVRAAGVRTLAPFWSDVITNYSDRAGGPYGGVTRFGAGTVNGRAAFGVNWLDVTGVDFVVGNPGLRNFFQLVLVDRSDVAAGDFDFEFNYDRMDWHSVASVGWSNADGSAAFERAGGDAEGAFADGGAAALTAGRRNSAVAGRYLFQVRGGQVLAEQASVVPEPRTWALVALGLGALLPAAARRRRLTAFARPAAAAGVLAAAACTDRVAAPAATQPAAPAGPRSAVGSISPAPDPGTDPTSLRAKAAARGFFYGCVLNNQFFSQDPDHRAAVARECSIIGAENALKMGPLRPTATTYAFGFPDAMINFAAANKQAVRGHAIVWHQGLPSWFASTITDSVKADQLLQDHIATVIGRYKGKIRSWDVVNEAVRPADGRSDGLRREPWLRLYNGSTRYIDRAFQLAHAADPDAILVYNENDLEADGPQFDTKRRFTLMLLDSLLARGVPVHALGMQMHVGVGSRFTALPEFIRRVKARGLRVQITELDASENAAISDTAAVDATVGAVYRRGYAAIEGGGGVEELATWGLSDKYTWLNGFFGPQPDGGKYRPLPLGANMERKAAWTALSDGFTQAATEAPTVTKMRAEPRTGPIRASVKACDGATMCLTFKLGPTTPDSGPYALRVEWGDGQVQLPTGGYAADALVRIPHDYAAAGTYTVRVLLYDQRGYEVTAQIPVTVQP